MTKPDVVKEIVKLMPKKMGHEKFCGINPEWRDKENMGKCDCIGPTYDEALATTASHLAERVVSVEEIKECVIGWLSPFDTTDKEVIELCQALQAKFVTLKKEK